MNQHSSKELNNKSKNIKSNLNEDLNEDYKQKKDIKISAVTINSKNI